MDLLDQFSLLKDYLDNICCAVLFINILSDIDKI